MGSSDTTIYGRATLIKSLLILEQMEIKLIMFSTKYIVQVFHKTSKQLQRDRSFQLNQSVVAY